LHHKEEYVNGLSQNTPALEWDARRGVGNVIVTIAKVAPTNASGVVMGVQFVAIHGFSNYCIVTVASFLCKSLNQGLTCFLCRGHHSTSKDCFIEIIEIGLQRAYCAHFVNKTIAPCFLQKDGEADGPTFEGNSHSAAGCEFGCM
jgi:hypothetical protein